MSSNTTETPSTAAPAPAASSESAMRARIVELPLTTHMEAVAILIEFVNVAHRRGIYSMEESHKIWECVRMFLPPKTSAAPATAAEPAADVITAGREIKE